MSPIAIESNRLVMATWTLADLPAAAELWGDPKVMEFIDVRGSLNSAQVEQKLLQEIERQEQYGVQYWKTALKDTGEIIGCCGLKPYDLPNRVYELGFHIMSRHWGKGYAPEAARAVIRHAFENLHAAKLFAGHNPKNSKSKVLLEKLGFKYTGDQFYEPTGLYHPSYELVVM